MEPTAKILLKSGTRKGTIVVTNIIFIVIRTKIWFQLLKSSKILELDFRN